MADTDKKQSATRLEHIELGTPASKELPNHMTKITRSSWLDNKKGIFICLIINMTTFEYGLDQGMVNGFQAMPGFLRDFGYKDASLPGGYGISTTVQQLIASLVSAGMFISTFTAGWLCNKIGRKGGIWVGLLLMILSVTLQIAVINITALYVGRVILGFSNGLLLVCAQLYIQETMPSNLRSLSFTIWQFWISFGALIGTVVNNETSKRVNRSSYRIPLAVLYIIPVFLGVVLFFLPETPRFLAGRCRYDDARCSLRSLRDAAYTDLQIERELSEIKYAIEADMEISSKVGYLEIFRPTAIKRTVTSLGLGLFSAANGVPFVTQYGVYFFLLSGDTQPFRDGVILLCVGLAGVLSTPFFIGKIGKRCVLFTGGFVQAMCMLGMAISYTIDGVDKLSGRVIIAMCSIYLFVVSATTSPFSWQVAGELPAQHLRGHTLGFVSSVTYLCGWSITFTIPYFINPTALNWGAKYAYIWFATNLLICLFTFFVVPETNGRTLEEIDECFNEGVAIRRFPDHQCVRTMRSRLGAAKDGQRA